MLFHGFNPRGSAPNHTVATQRSVACGGKIAFLLELVYCLYSVCIQSIVFVVVVLWNHGSHW